MAQGKKTGGRSAGTPNKSTAEIRELAQAYGPAALRVAARLMRKSENEATQLAAAKELLERGYGKPMQPQHHTGAVGTYDLTGIDLDKLRELERILSPLAATIGDPGRDSEA
jgi:hypothetical protein